MQARKAGKTIIPQGKCDPELGKKKKGRCPGIPGMTKHSHWGVLRSKSAIMGNFMFSGDEHW
jgi:hypothetical protein